MAEVPRQKGDYPSLEHTTHNRVYKTTSDRANELARQWNTTKLEVYRYLVDMAIEKNLNPQTEVKYGTYRTQENS